MFLFSGNRCIEILGAQVRDAFSRLSVTLPTLNVVTAAATDAL